MAESTISLLTAIVMLVGIVMFFSARFFRTADAPRGYTWNPKKWIPIWRQKQWFRSPGFFLLIAGYLTFSLAFIIRVILLPWPC